MNNSTEAPASVTYSISRNGFNILFTIRGETGTVLLDTMETIEKKLTDLGYTAQEKRGFGGGSPKPAPQVVEGEKCPKCGNDLVYQTTKTGKKMMKCSTQKYDFMTKSSTGCDFVKWLN